MTNLWYELSFRQPLWLLLTAQPLVLLLLARLLTAHHSGRYSDAHLRPWVNGQLNSGNVGRYLRAVLFFMAWLMLAIAMAGPRLPEAVADQQTTSQRELMVLLDMSPSMSARDVRPNRLERAKLELLDLIQRMQGTRMGIIVYGAQSHLLSPMTQDKNVLRHYVNAIHARQLPTLGSRLDRAIDLAGNLFEQQNKTPRAMLIISDGEHHTDPTQQQALEKRIATLKQQGIRVYALGVGTAYGAPVMAEDQGWLSYDGQTVNSRLQASHLQRLTQLGDGLYSDTRDNNLDWQRLYDEGIGRLQPVTKLNEKEQTRWRELYHSFVIASILFLLLGMWQPAIKSKSANIAIILTVLTSSGFTQDGYAVEVDYQTAYGSLKAEDYQRAKQQFSRLAGYAARLGEGSAAYRLRDYKAAAQQFIQAMLDATNDQQRGHALFNLANCRYQLADYRAAAMLYQDVLRYLPGHQGAMTNLAYAKALQRDEHISDRIARRAGRGAQSGRLPDGVSTEGVRGITLGDDKDKKIILPDNNTAATTSNTKNLYQARTASGNVDQQEDSEWDYRINSLEQLQQENPRVSSDPAQFWQRLYEWEEGFMAPVEQSHHLPEVKPW